MESRRECWLDAGFQNKGDTSKASIERKSLFLNWKYNTTKKKQIKAMKDAMSVERWVAYKRDEDKANQWVNLCFRLQTITMLETFQGMTRDKANSKRSSFRGCPTIAPPRGWNVIFTRSLFPLWWPMPEYQDIKEMGPYPHGKCTKHPGWSCTRCSPI